VTEGRVVEITRIVGLADVRPDATARLDALARILQDVADADVASATIDGMGVWVVRRIGMHLARTPRFRAEIRARTCCSGTGPRWAERRTELSVADTLCVQATALWVHTDPQSGAPRELPPGFAEVWGTSENARRVSARLQHTSPPTDARRERWILRATDLDVLGHVNNAAYWAPVEEELAARGRPRVQHAEIEFRAGLDLGDAVDVLVADGEGGFATWLVVDGDVRASMLVGCAP
jgi:acyl-ACP thioesterase